MKQFGNTAEICDVDKICIDEPNKLITTPAYMKDTATPYEVFKGIDKMISETIKKIKVQQKN